MRMKRWICLLMALVLTGLLAGAAGEAATSLSFVNRTVELWLGYSDRPSSIELKPDVTPAGAALSWSSSDERVAIVDTKGTLTAVGGGKSTISVKSGNKRATCTVVVTQGAESLTLSEHSLMIAKGANARLKADIQPAKTTNKKVNWSSSNEDIAKVNSNGGISGRNPGTCIITCVADDGTGKVDSCTVTVVQQANGIRAVYADGSNAAKILMPAGKNRTVFLNYIPEDTSWKETVWTQTDDVAVVDRRADATTMTGQLQVRVETAKSAQPRNPVVTVNMESGEEITLYSNRPGKAIINGRAADGGQGKVRIDVLVEPAVSVFGTYDADSGTQNGIPWIQPFVENTSTYRTVDSLTLELRARDRRDNDME